MKRLWIVVADAREVRIYKDEGGEPVLVESIAVAADESRGELATALADVLGRAHAEGRYDELGLVMPSKLLELVRTRLAMPTREAVVAELHRSLMRGPVEKVLARVRAARPPLPLI